MVHDFVASAARNEKKQTAGRTATAVYLGLIFLVLPLAVHHGYFDITETKFLVFLCVSAVYVLATLLLWLLGRAVSPFRPQKGLMAADLGLALFVLCFCAGALLSGGAGALVGLGARYQGVLSIILYALVYLCVSRNFCFTIWNGVCLAAGFMLVCLVAVLNDFGLDPLRIVNALDARQRWQFVSTLGNTNFYSAFVGTLLPVALAGWCLAEKRAWRTLSALALLCGFCGMLPTASESFVLALAAGIWLLPPFLFDRPHALRRYLAALFAMTLTLGILKAVMRFVPTVQYVSVSLRALMQTPVLIGVAVVSAALIFALRNKNTPLRGKKAYFLVSFALVLCGATCVVLCNTVWRDLSFGPLDRFIRLDADWGTDRGRIWAYCLAMFRDATPIQKLIGGGPGCLARYDMAHRLFPDAILDSAHNEYLQYLLVSGVTGLLGYLTFVAGTVAAALKRAGSRPMAPAFAAGALAYAAQAFVNIAQPVSTPYLFLLLGMAAGCVIQSNAENGAMPPLAEASAEAAE